MSTPLDLKGFDRSELYGEHFTQPMRRQHEAIKTFFEKNPILSALQECLGDRDPCELLGLFNVVIFVPSHCRVKNSVREGGGDCHDNVVLF